MGRALRKRAGAEVSQRYEWESASARLAPRSSLIRQGEVLALRGTRPPSQTHMLLGGPCGAPGIGGLTWARREAGGSRAGGPRRTGCHASDKNVPVWDRTRSLSIFSSLMSPRLCMKRSHARNLSPGCTMCWQANAAFKSHKQGVFKVALCEIFVAFSFWPENCRFKMGGRRPGGTPATRRGASLQSEHVPWAPLQTATHLFSISSPHPGFALPYCDVYLSALCFLTLV